MAFAKNRNINVALVSPGTDVNAETFIRAHKNLLPFNILFFYNGFIPAQLEGIGSIAPGNRFKFVKEKIIKNLSSVAKKFSDEEFFLYNAFKKNKVHVVLAEYGPTGAAICNVCTQLKLPLLTFFHGYDASIKSVLEKHKENYKLLFKHGAVIFSVSSSMSESLIRAGCNAVKITLNIYGPDNDFLEVVPSYSKQKFIAVGRFVDKKAPYYTILAFSKVTKKFPEARLVMAGDGILWNMCKNLISYLNLQKNIEMPGTIDKQFFLNELKDTIAFVQHSVVAINGDSEGTPVAILEAFAAGVPVIATRHAGIIDIIQHGVNGLLVNEHDVNAMAEEMIYLLENNHEARQLGTNARKNIADNYRMEKHINIIADKINEVFSANSKL